MSFASLVDARNLHRGWKRYLLIFPPLFALIFYVAYWIANPNLGSGFLALGLLFVACMPFFLRPWGKALYNRSPAYLYEVSGEISESGISVTNATGTFRIPWEDVTRLRMNSRIMLIYRGWLQFYMLAAEFFASEEDWHTAIDRIRSSVKRAR